MIKFWKCAVTGEILVGSKWFGFGVPLFGNVLPFLGWKRVACTSDGSFDPVWPPKYTILKVGVMWLGHGKFVTSDNELPETVKVSS